MDQGEFISGEAHSNNPCLKGRATRGCHLSHPAAMAGQAMASLGATGHPWPEVFVTSRSHKQPLALTNHGRPLPLLAHTSLAEVWGLATAGLTGLTLPPHWQHCSPAEPESPFFCRGAPSCLLVPVRGRGLQCGGQAALFAFVMSSSLERLWAALLL